MTLQEVLWINKNAGSGGGGRRGRTVFLMGILFCHRGKLVKLQLCVTVNFLVCALCLQALVVPPSVKLSALFLTSGIRWSVGSHTGMITPIDHEKKGEDIKGVCHTPVRASFVFFQIFLFAHGKVS